MDPLATLAVAVTPGNIQGELPSLVVALPKWAPTESSMHHHQPYCNRETLCHCHKDLQPAAGWHRIGLPDAPNSMPFVWMVLANFSFSLCLHYLGCLPFGGVIFFFDNSLIGSLRTYIILICFNALYVLLLSHCLKPP